MSTILESLDERDPLAAVAADRASVDDESAACTATWAYLSVSPDALHGDDRAAFEKHLAACARCRAVALEAWLDGDVAPLALHAVPVTGGVLPRATSMPRRAWRARMRPVVTAVAAAIATVALVTAGVRWLHDDTSEHLHERRPGVTAPSIAPPVGPLAVVIVYPGTQRWMGNDTYTVESPPPGSPPRPDEVVMVRHVWHGKHDALVQGLSGLAMNLPAGSKIGAIAFDGVNVWPRQTLVPTESIDPSRVVGPQEEYGAYIGSTSQASALGFAADELRSVRGARRVVVLLTESCDAGDPADQSGAFAAARARLDAEAIEVRVVFTEPDMEVDDHDGNCPHALWSLDPHPAHPKLVTEVPQAMLSVLGL